MNEQSLTLVNTPVISDKKKIADALMVTAFFLLCIWTAFALDHFLDFDLRKYGLKPRTAEGLTGIFTIHFLHGDLNHAWQNSISFLVMNSFLFYFYRSISIKTFIFLFILPGILLWLGGRSSNHIGASMLIYGEAAFLFTSGLIRGNPLMLRVSLVIALYYGGLVWYLFPVVPHISWEGHLSGAIVGTALAFFLRNQGPARKKYNWEIEEELEEAEAKLAEEQENTEQVTRPVTPVPGDSNQVKVTYIYRENNPGNDHQKKD